MSEISRLNFINIYAYEFGQPAILASKRTVNSVKRGRLQEQHLSTQREHDTGLAPILVIWSQLIRSYLRLNESLESNICETFSRPVSIFLFFFFFLDHFSLNVLWVIYRPVPDGSGKSYMIVFFSLHFVVWKGVSHAGPEC